MKKFKAKIYDFEKVGFERNGYIILRTKIYPGSEVSSSLPR